MPSALCKLIRFRVTNFRSVEDSGWIDVDDVGGLIGTNESGKTNLLIPLWKLNPAKNGTIDPLADYPRKRYHELRSIEPQPIFIYAEFEVADTLALQLATLLNVSPAAVKRTIVTRDFAGEHDVEFPALTDNQVFGTTEMVLRLEATYREIESADASTAKTEGSIKDGMLAALDSILRELRAGVVDLEQLRQMHASLSGVDTTKLAKRSLLIPLHGKAIDVLTEKISVLEPPPTEQMGKAREVVIEHLPAFVYYSNYGNLDSEIYLPHVIDNMSRQGLGLKDEAKARTLKVLFDFVRLKPAEILELGRDFRHPNQPSPTQEQIDAIARKKKERSVLLQSASTDLTRKFRDWWKQGEYRIEFQADGDHFRIWVSDDKRPEKIELEARSTGLQWFLSFYLVFLVESTDAHEGAILLLDEPGLSLHALAQRDLSSFFENLASTNQLIYTTHSPFLVDPNHLDRIKAVYVNDAGVTCVSSNLRAGEGNSSQTKSIYPVHAALGLSVSDTLLQGCEPVIVEGTADQHYLSAAKIYLIRKGLLIPPREIVFVPGGGVRSIAAVISVVSSREEELPVTLLDSDQQGQGQAKKLKDGLYAHAAQRVLQAADFTSVPNAEIEDLFPRELVARSVARILPRTEIEFEEVVRPELPIVPQIEQFAAARGISLQLGWKVELAKRVKAAILASNKDALKSYPQIVELWKALFAKILQPETAATSTSVGKSIAGEQP